MKNVLEYLEKTAARLPEKTAVVEENGAISYAELLANARRIGSALAAKTPPRRPVPVLMEKGIAALECFFGALYAGCFYVTLNPDLPPARLAQVAEQLDPPFLVSDADHLSCAAELAGERPVFLLDELIKTPADEALLAERREEQIDADPLYTNFTSGSSGKPKGVVVPHRAAITFIETFCETFGFTENDRFINQAPLDFDVSVKDIYSSLRCGGTLILTPKAYFSQPAALLDFICLNRPTVMIWAVSALCLMTTFHALDYKVPETVRLILFSGEVMPAKHLKQWMEKLPKTEFINLYGPTEITCNCTYYRVERGKDYSNGLPIGKAFSNQRVFLLDENDREITLPGKKGEICVSATSLALGYYGAQAQTEAVFVQNPVNPRYYERVYRTGDLAFYNAERQLVFCGRKDFQIKHQGHRIEPEEIEAAMMKIAGVERASCVYEEARGRLWGFYVGSAETADLERELAEKLPVYMIPRLRKVEAMPLTKNGKIDRKELLLKK